MKITISLMVCLIVGILSENEFEKFQTKVLTEIQNLKHNTARNDQEILDLKSQLQDTKAELIEAKDYNKWPNKVIGLYHAPKNCLELLKYGFNESRMYFLDLDGIGVQNPPIEVFCELPSGKTIVGESHETEIEPCPDALCHKFMVPYKYPIDQLTLLVDSSISCSQWIKFDCFSTPSKVNINTLA